MKKNRNRNAAAGRREERNAGAYTGQKAEKRDREGDGSPDAGAEGAPDIQRREIRIQEMPAREAGMREMPWKRAFPKAGRPGKIPERHRHKVWEIIRRKEKTSG